MGKKILVSGASSGLGKFLFNKFNAVRFNRKSNNKKSLLETNWDLIIHCAFDSKTFDIKNFEKYMKDNIANSLFLSSLKGRKIFMSSTQVYESNKLSLRSERDYIDVKKLTLYPLTKYTCENFFKDTDIVLRLGSIIGEGMRKNTIYNILNTKLPKIYLNKNSKFSFVSYEEIYEIILLILSKKRRGIFNVLRNDFISLNKVAKKFNISKIKYGKHTFNATIADNDKILKIKNLKNKSSLEILKSIKK
jgi:nucleoside-diphosphate-sugar epimerase